MTDPVVVDARGERCPAPIIKIAAAARDVAPGTVLVLWATDPATRHDLAAWCRMRGHALRSRTELGEGVSGYEVEVGGAG